MEKDLSSPWFSGINIKGE